MNADIVPALLAEYSWPNTLLAVSLLGCVGEAFCVSIDSQPPEVSSTGTTHVAHVHSTS